MRTATRIRVTALLIAGIVLVIVIALIAKKLAFSGPEVTIDPHAGQVNIYDGFDWVWMTPLEGVPVNDLTEDKFTTQASGKIEYIGGDYEVLRGVDVSEHQWGIDWAKVRSAGVDFAYIRVGYRGNTEGGLFEDPYFETNISGASANGLKTGVYFYSQAITVEEAQEEAAFVLERIKGHRMDLPVIFDWEKVEGGGARTDNLTLAVRTQCAVAFCEAVENAGYEAGVYFNRNLGYYGYDLTKLTDYTFWFALPEMGYPSFYYDIDIWQYSFTETISGIDGETDMNMLFVPKATSVPSPAVG